MYTYCICIFTRTTFRNESHILFDPLDTPSRLTDTTAWAREKVIEAE